jgi:hypothetical protein
MAIVGNVGAIYVQTGTSATITNEDTTANTAFTRYTITNQVKRYLDPDAIITVKKNGTTITTGYTIEYAGGVIVFDNVLTNTDVVTVSGKYFTMSQSAGFFNWKLELERDMGEITTFASSGWKESLPTITGYTASAEQYWGDASFYNLLGSRMLFVLYVDSTISKSRYEGYGYINKDEIEVNVEDIVSESIDIQGNGKLYYREG